MRKLAPLLILTAAILSCTPTFDTTYTSPLYLPIIRDGPIPVTTPKKGVSLGPGGCDLLRALGASWYYTGKQCEGFERVPYLDTSDLLGEAVTKPAPEGKLAMFLNECDMARWGCPPVTEQVRLLIAAEAAWPGIIWVGPCSSGDVQYVQDFWIEYTRQTGHLPNPETHRGCVHCYNTASNCAWLVNMALLESSQFGITSIWVTEFGLPLGLGLSINEAMQENGAFVAWMEANPQVERWAYWCAKIAYYGYTIPSKPVSGFYPLGFDWLNEDGTVVERLTDMGLWFANAP